MHDRTRPKRMSHAARYFQRKKALLKLGSLYHTRETRPKEQGEVDRRKEQRKLSGKLNRA
jgi:hypothetical protein